MTNLNIEKAMRANALSSVWQNVLSTTKGLFTRREKDPSTKKILEGGTNVSLDSHAEISVLAVTSKEEIKDLRLLTKRPAAIFVWFILCTRIFPAKAVYMVLGDSLS